MGDENANQLPQAALPDFLLQNIVASQVNLQNAMQQLMHLQVANMRATFASMPMDQRDTYCKSLQASGYPPSHIAALTEKSYPTINRHLNGKNS